MLVDRSDLDPQRRGAVLLVSADRPWLASATAFLAVETRTLSTAETSGEAIDAAMGQPPDVVVIAPPIGGGSPLSLITQLSVLRDRAPLGIVYVAEREREVAEHARLMRAGANDWFPRGLPASEAAKRIAALITEIRAPDLHRYLTRGPLSLDSVARQAMVAGVPVGLSVGEYAILETLAHAAGRLMTPGEIAAAIGARRGSRTASTIGVQIERLREKLGAARGLIEASRRYGYRLRFVAPL